MLYKISAFILLFISVSIAQSTTEYGKLSGQIIDAETNKHVSYAVIEIMPQIKFRAAREDGSFDMDKIIPGNYQIRITHINYEDKIVDINIESGKTTEIAAYLFSVVHEIPKVVVKSQHLSSKLEQFYELSHTLKGKELQKDLSLTLASTLKNNPGISMRSMGPAPARPVIRGLSGNRVLMSEDGIKTSDLSATSPDHAVTIDPFTLEGIEVIRGPKVVIQSPTTIGGIVNVIRNDIPPKLEDHIIGTAGLSAESVSKSYTGAAKVNIPFGSTMFSGELSRRVAENQNTPVGELSNSYSRNLNYSLGISHFFDFGLLALSGRTYETEYGIPGGFVGAHPNGVNIEIGKRQYNFKSRINLDEDKKEHLDLNLSRVYYRHTEYESSGLIGAEFKIIDYLGNLDFHHRKMGMFENGIIGISFQHKDFNIGGFVFTPQSNSLNLAGYIFEALYFDKFNFEFGARLNYDSIKPNKEEVNSKIGHIRERDYFTYSASISALYEFSHDLYAGINLSKSSRVPTIEELFSEGPHLAAYSYEIGNPDLEDESGVGTEIFAYYKTDNFYSMITYYRNDMSSFIIPRNTGELNFTQLLPIYSSEGVKALIQGFEAELKAIISDSFEFTFVADYTSGTFKDNNLPLPGIPPLKGNIEIKYFSDQYSFGISSEFADSQNKVDEFEEPTAGYITFGAFAQYSIISSSFIHNFSLTLNNITDKEYRNHLSRIKSVMPEAGFNARLIYKLFFHL